MPTKYSKICGGAHGLASLSLGKRKHKLDIYWMVLGVLVDRGNGRAWLGGGKLLRCFPEKGRNARRK